MPDERIDRIVEEWLAGRATSRRTFVQRLGAAGFVLSGASTFLAACGGIEGENEGSDGAKKTPTPAAEVNHPKVAFDRLDFANWPLYIEKKVLKDFEKEFGAKVKYTEEINDNEEFFGKIRQPLASGEDIKRDIVVLTDWMASRMVRLDYVQPLDKKNIPNAKNLQPSLASPVWDKERTLSLPWQSGMTGIGYNKKKVGREITSLNDLFDPAFKGRVSLFSEGREAANFMLLRKGKDPATATIDDVLAAIEEVDAENRKGQIRRFTGNDYTTDLTKGNLWLCQAYSGDLVQLKADNPDLDFLIPEEGATIWTDNMMIPKTSKNQYAAEVMMNYVYEPEVAAKIAAYVNYVTPVVGAKEILAASDPELADNQLIFPNEETLAKLHPYVDLDEAEEKQMNEAMQAVVGA
jgi:spermidine/putrescine transport system substrate-binding protein